MIHKQIYGKEGGGEGKGEGSHMKLHRRKKQALKMITNFNSTVL